MALRIDNRGDRRFLELCNHHPEADRDLVQVLAWLHDYSKIIDFDREHDPDMLVMGRDALLACGFDQAFADKAAHYIHLHDSYKEMDMRTAPIEVQISSSADGCSHLVGPFLPIFWHESTDKTFTNKTLDELMELNRKKIDKDWNLKIVLPEARAAFGSRYKFHREQAGELPAKFLP